MMNDLLNQLRNTPRLRMGIALILGMAWLYGVLLLRDEVDAQNQRFRNSTQVLGRLKAQLAEPQWVTRAPAARTLAVQLEGKLWQAPTPGLAQATLQDWLTKSMAKAGIATPQITVAAVEEAPPGTVAPTDPVAPTDADAMADLWKIKAKMSFELNPPVLMDFLATLETHERQTTVRTLIIRKEPAPRVELETLNYFQKQSSTSDNPPTQRPPPMGKLP